MYVIIIDPSSEQDARYLSDMLRPVQAPVC